MSERAIVGEFRMEACQGVPEGLTAYAQPTGPDGTYATDRKGRVRVARVQLRSAAATSPHRPKAISNDSDWVWLTSSPRRWSSLVKRFGNANRAWETCCTLAREGCGAIEHSLELSALRQPPLQWIPHPELKAAHESRKAQRRAAQDETSAEANKLSAHLAAMWPGVAASLRLPLAPTQLEWVLRAGRDLAQEIHHDGVRAFVQAHHPDDDKAREDLPTLLRQSGWEPEAIRELGVDRNPYIGIGGPILAHHGARTLDWTGWPGPHDIRLPHGINIRLSVPPSTEILVIIENRQAAETVCDRYPTVPMIWCRGHHSDRVLDLIDDIARNCRETLICTDADLGGLRIAARLHNRIRQRTAVSILDIGDQTHRPGRQFTDPTLAGIAEYELQPGPVGAFASGIRSRGYAVTQEALVRSALQSRLGTSQGRCSASGFNP